MVSRLARRFIDHSLALDDPGATSRFFASSSRMTTFSSRGARQSAGTRIAENASRLVTSLVKLRGMLSYRPQRCADLRFGKFGSPRMPAAAAPIHSRGWWVKIQRQPLLQQRGSSAFHLQDSDRLDWQLQLVATATAFVSIDEILQEHWNGAHGTY